MPESTEFDTPSDYPSLLDDAAFLAELEKLEGGAPASSPGRSVHARRAAMPAPADLVIPRDVNRWHLHAPPGVEPAPIVEQRAAGLPALAAILIGLCAGAAGSAFVFYERLTQIIARFAN